MKRSVIFAVCSFCSLLGCRSKTLPQTQAPAVTAEDSREIIFKRKMECEKYRQQLMDGLIQNQVMIEAVYRVFYSSKENSCLAAKFTLYPKSKVNPETAEIDDILTQKRIWFVHYPEAKQYPEVHADLDEQIAKLE